jgi:hypothetical protein
MHVLALPSGETQQSDGAAGFESSGAGGGVRAYINWIAADHSNEYTTTDIALPASTQEYAATRTTAGDGWVDAFHLRSELIYPEDFLTDVTATNKWSLPPVAVEIQLQHVGGARVVDCCIYEVPLAQAMEADDADDEWVAHMWGSHNFQVGATYPTEVRITGADGDPRGIHHLMDVHHGQAARLGPKLFSWNAWIEDAADPAAIAEAYIETDSAAWRQIAETGHATYTGATDAGFSMSAGAYARNQDDNGHWVFPTQGGAGESCSASVPVILYLWAAAESDGTIRFQTGDHMWIDVTIDNATPQFFVAYGHLRCGLGPEDPVVCVPLWQSGTEGHYLRLYHMSCYVSRAAPATDL